MARAGDWMETFTHKAFWPLDPKPEEIDPVDIAHSLAMQCRFTGHTPEPYSIAQHSVLVSRRAEELAPAGKRTMIALWGLLHDASEAYLVDVARPVKRFLTNYIEIEKGVMRAVCLRFGLPEEMPFEVRRADDELLATEAREFFPERLRAGDWHLAHEPLPGPLGYWSHRESEHAFWYRLIDLGGLRR